MRWRLGYNTNGFQSHRLMDALKVMAEIGYNSVALTLDHAHLDPDHLKETEMLEVQKFLRDQGMACVVETGGRYLLDPWKKHYPSLISAENERRKTFLKKALEITANLGAPCLTFFSGRPEPGEDLNLLFEKLCEAIEELAVRARELGVLLGIEPEPGMLVESITDYLYVKQLTGLEELKLTLDIGHVHCTENISIAQALHSYASEIINVHIEDMLGKDHLHLPFGQGNINFKSVFKALNKIGPAFPLHVELSRSSHNAPEIAMDAFEFLTSKLR